jgi:hypothetical protein
MYAKSKRMQIGMMTGTKNIFDKSIQIGTN